MNVTTRRAYTWLAQKVHIVWYFMATAGATSITRPASGGETDYRSETNKILSCKTLASAGALCAACAWNTPAPVLRKPLVSFASRLWPYALYTACLRGPVLPILSSPSYIVRSALPCICVLCNSLTVGPRRHLNGTSMVPQWDLQWYLQWDL